MVGITRESMMENIVNIDLNKIHPHPEQDKVYSSELDYKFIESIRTVGILQPVLLAPGEIIDGKIVLHPPTPLTKGELKGDEYDSYIAVSGHRRIKASKELGNLTIPAIIKDYKHPILIDLDFLESNRNREKNENEKKHEFGLSYQILSQVTKYKKNKGDKFALNKDSGEIKEGFGTVSRTLELWQNIEEFLTKIGVDISKPLNLRTAISLATGLSEREVRRKMKLEEEYWGNKQEKWEKVLKYEKLEKLYKEYYEALSAYRGNEVDEDTTIAIIEKIVNKIDAMYEKALGEKEEKSKKKEKVYLSLPISKNPNYELDAKVYDDQLKQTYYVINPVKIRETLIKDFGRELTWVEYMEKLIPKMKDSKFYAPRGEEKQRQESDGCRIEDVIAILLGLKWI